MGFTRVLKKSDSRGKIEKRVTYQVNKQKIEMKKFDRKKMHTVTTVNHVDFLGSKCMESDCWCCGEIIYDEILCNKCRNELNSDNFWDK